MLRGRKTSMGPRSRILTLTQIGDGFYLDQHFRLCKGPHFYKRGSWKISGKELTARSPDLGIILDIDYVDRHLDQVIHRTTGGFDDAINA
jgi:hypothetical protein